jgi:hypothetical protein
MKYLSVSIVFTLLFSFCKNKGMNNAEYKNESAQNDSIFRLSEHYSKFKFYDLKDFKSDTFYIDERRMQYKELDSVAMGQIIQGDKAFEMGACFYYSTFLDSTLIAILHETSDENGEFIWLLKYDKNGKLKSKFSIAGGWGDAGDSQYSYGKVIKENAFTSTHVYSSMLGDDIENTDNQIDSLVFRIRFEANSTMKLDTIFKNQEIIKNKKNNGSLLFSKENQSLEAVIFR